MIEWRQPERQGTRFNRVEIVNLNADMIEWRMIAMSPAVENTVVITRLLLTSRDDAKVLKDWVPYPALAALTRAAYNCTSNSSSPL